MDDDDFYLLTPQLERDIVMYVRGGGTLPTSSEAAGLPSQVLRTWLELGQQGHEPYRSFAKAIRQAQAQARLRAELNEHDRRSARQKRLGDR